MKIKKYPRGLHPNCRKGGFQKGNIPWQKNLPKEKQPMFGKHHTEETKQKIRNLRLGKKSNMDGIIKYRIEHNGTWNKGLKKENDQRVMNNSMKVSASRKELFAKGILKHPWIGKHHTDETKQKIRKKHLGISMSEEAKVKMKLNHCSKKKGYIHPQKGRKLSDSQKDLISNSLKGRKQTKEWIIKRITPRIGKPISNETKMKIKEWRKHFVVPKKDTSIEVKVQKYLKRLQIEYFTHQYINIEHGYQCDILIPSMNLVIECDGDYWHKYPIGTDIDHIRTSELIKKGFKVLRLWEFEIRKMNLNEFKFRLGTI